MNLFAGRIPRLSLPPRACGGVLSITPNGAIIRLLQYDREHVPEDFSMPTYEYVCRKCGNKFSLTMSISEHDRKKAHCPKCKSMQVDQQLLSFFAVTSKKS